MSQPDIQYFSRNGTWVRPRDAAAVDVLAKGGGGGASPGADGEDGKFTVKRFTAPLIPETMDIQVGKGGRPGGQDGYVLVVTHLAREEAKAPRPVRQRTPGASYPQRGPCPACGQPVLVVQGSRHGGQAEAFDPEPGGSLQHNTMLADDQSHITLVAAQSAHLRGKVPLHRPHRYTCAAQMRIPGDVPLPAIGGYSHAAPGWKGARP